MYLSICDMHIASSDTTTQSADDADIAEVARMMHATQFDSVYDDDYDPFAEEDGNGNDDDSSISPPVAGGLDVLADEIVIDEVEDPVIRFPDYSWWVRQDSPGPTFFLAVPPSDTVHKYGNITIPGFRSPNLDKDGCTAFRSYNKSLIPYSWWEPFLQWLGPSHGAGTA